MFSNFHNLFIIFIFLLIDQKHLMVYHTAPVDSHKVFTCQDCHIINALYIDKIYQVIDLIFVRSISLIKLKKSIDCGLCIFG